MEKERWACSQVANSLKNSQFPFGKITNLLELMGRFVEERNGNLEKNSREVKVKSDIAKKSYRQVLTCPE